MRSPATLLPRLVRLYATKSYTIRPPPSTTWWTRRTPSHAEDGAARIRQLLNDILPEDTQVSVHGSGAEQGWMSVEQLLRHPSLSGVTFPAVEHLAQEGGRNVKWELRYGEKEAGMGGSECGSWWFRRVPRLGLPIRGVWQLKRIVRPSEAGFAVHGTTEEAWPKIATQGLSRMSSPFIYLGTHVHGSVVVGMDRPSAVLVHIDVGAAMEDGIVFYLSRTGVVATRGDGMGVLSARYIGEASTTSLIIGTLPQPRRKRAADNASPSQSAKREKTARQSRKRAQKDKNTDDDMPPFPDSQDTQQQHYPGPQYLSAPAPSTRAPPNDDSLSPEEAARRDRVRAAARERQRKHRALVKARKLRELGLDMGNEIMPPAVEEGPPGAVYRVDADGNYQPVLPHELHLQNLVAAQPPPPQGEPPFPQGPVAGGQTFATTLLLSFSCAPLLKQHLLRTLNMTNEELASLEPVIAEAWDRWDHARRTGIRYEHPEGFPPGAYPYPPGAVPAAGPPNGPPATDDFRGRFARVMTVPAPFQYAQNGEEAAAGAANEAIDPQLGAKEDDEDNEEEEET
ncbi:hypothetical protein MKEN_01009400 [Mycena kentingensis (nom. inval.)]|nr:hypothetical protein MKEN_01009400 [Mycena kentingensis (nom. inval.)]